ncbi:MAG: apolipoprotein N-acyltransferase [Bacillota bacterium]
MLVRGLGLPLVAGALCVLGFAPFYAWPVSIVALALLFHVLADSGSPLQAALSGFAFGLGCFLTGVSWMYVSLHDYGSMPAVLAALAVFIVCAYLALFPAGAAWVAIRWGGESAGSRLLALTAAFVGFEWLRGWLFTGFPWLTIGTSQIPSSPLAGYAPVVGAYGTSLAVAAVAALCVAFFSSVRLSRRRYLLLAAVAAIFLGGGILKSVAWTSPAGLPVRVALLQGNVAQELKWRDDMRLRTLADYARMILAARARVIVLPETALPAYLDELPADYLKSLRDEAQRQGKEILLGTVEREFRGRDFDYFNSVVNLNDPSQRSYQKRHLVPFGEYIPPGFKFILAVLKIPLSDFTSGRAHPVPISADGLRFGVAICYEDIFGEEMIEQLPDAQVLLNVSNDAWFGRSLAAEQHLQSSQMRALETGRWMVRATNTGVTAAIDEKGRVVAELPVFTRGTLVQDVPPRSGRTPYVAIGNWGALALVALLAIAAFRRRRR